MDGIAGWGIVPQAPVTSAGFGRRIACESGDRNGRDIVHIGGIVRGSSASVQKRGWRDCGRHALGKRRLLDVADVLPPSGISRLYAAGAVLVVAIGVKLGSAAN